MGKEMEKEKNLITRELYYLKVNTQMEKKTEKEKIIILIMVI